MLLPSEREVDPFHEKQKYVNLGLLISRFEEMATIECKTSLCYEIGGKILRLRGLFGYIIRQKAGSNE